MADVQPPRAEAMESRPGPSNAAIAQPAGRPTSAPAAAAAAKQVKRLHSPTEGASQKLQRRSSEGHGPGAAASVAADVSAAVPAQIAAGRGQSVGLPAPTVNGIPANLAGTLIERILCATFTATYAHTSAAVHACA